MEKDLSKTTAKTADLFHLRSSVAIYNHCTVYNNIIFLAHWLNIKYGSVTRVEIKNLS